MNHTERIAETARCHRSLSRRLVKETVEIYFTSRAKGANTRASQISKSRRLVSWWSRLYSTDNRQLRKKVPIPKGSRPHQI